MKDTRFIAQAILSAEELLSDGTHWDCSNSRRAVRWERDRDMTIILLRQALERLDGIEAKDPTTDN